MFFPTVNHSLKYSPSLDGLRGLAILLVLLFHIWPEYFSFGYVGVDIFFVLSGYLITQIIYLKLQDDKFSLAEFYRNRIRRIFPALIVVLSTTLIIGYLFMFSGELEQLGKHVKSSAFFYENFRLIGEVGYWDEAAVQKPLLHFWSLAIEEQFYIFWPLILIILHKARLDIAISLFILFFILFITPFFIEIDNFYHTLSRAWELSFGGLVFVASYKHKNIGDFVNKFKVLIYLAFFLAIYISYDSNSFNIYKTFLIVFFSGLLILSFSNESKTIFSNNILVFFGLISFPLYLWHFVLISFSHIFKIDFYFLNFVLVLVSIFLSYLTYRYIEIYSRSQNSYKFALMLFFIVISLGLISQYISKKDGLSERSHLESNIEFQKQFKRLPPKNTKGIELISRVLGYKPGNNYVKSTSNSLNSKFILIIGDSHAHTSYPGFAEEFKKIGYETILLANSACQPLINGAMGAGLKGLKVCENKIKTIYDFVNEFDEKIEKIIYVSRGPKYIYNTGFGAVDNGIKPSNYFFKDY